MAGVRHCAEAQKEEASLEANHQQMGEVITDLSKELMLIQTPWENSKDLRKTPIEQIS